MSRSESEDTDRTLVTFTCENCGYVAKVYHSLLYHDMEQRLMVMRPNRSLHSSELMLHPVGLGLTVLLPSHTTRATICVNARRWLRLVRDNQGPHRDGGPDSPAILEKALVAAHVPSYEIGAVLLREVGGVSITGRGLNTMVVRIGTVYWFSATLSLGVIGVAELPGFRLKHFNLFPPDVRGPFKGGPQGIADSYAQ